MWAIDFVVERWRLLLATSLFLGVVYLTLFITKFTRRRRFYADLPKPPHDFLWGHAKLLGEALKNYPADMHPQPLFSELAIQNDLKGLYYLDMFPFTSPWILVLDPAVAIQTQNPGVRFDRHEFARSVLEKIVGAKSMFNITGKPFQEQKSWFQPAFALSNILTLVPGMIEETLIFKEHLTRLSVSGEKFSMIDYAMKLTIDVIGSSVGNMKFHSQTQHSPVQHSFMKSLEWTAGRPQTFWERWLSPIMMPYYVRILNRELTAMIQNKFSNTTEDNTDKTILDLALRGYLKDRGMSLKGKAGTRRMDKDPEFMQIALDNAKLFFFGGHDTTASTIAYLYYHLSREPELLARVRAEHDEIFGNTFEATMSTLEANPSALNKLPLTHALVKEILRFHPIGFTMKQGAPGATLRYNGRDYPTEGHTIAILTAYMHRDSAHFENPMKFDPDRWLAPEVDKAGAWQPFEKGPRGCIGQQLAMVEVKLIAVMTLREFDFEDAFEPDAQRIDGYGGRAYQVLKMTAKPKDGIPMRVRLRGEKRA